MWGWSEEAPRAGSTCGGKPAHVGGQSTRCLNSHLKDLRIHCYPARFLLPDGQQVETPRLAAKRVYFARQPSEEMREQISNPPP